MTRSARVGRMVAIAAVAGVLVTIAPAPANAASVTIAAAGDIARRNAPGTPQQKTAAVITDVIKPSRVLALGDEQYDHGEYAQFLASYDPTWGAFKSITAPVPGNHEYETPGAAGYFQYFNSVLTGYGTTATDPTRGYYSFDLGDWHIAAINSNCSVVSCSQQKAWLRSDLAADDHLCQLVFYHHAKNKGLSNTFAAAGGDVILGGHKHTYERWDSSFGKDVRRFIVGTGGKSAGSPDPAADAGVQAFGVLKLVLNPTGYTWSFIDVNRNVRDSGSGTCHA